MEQTIVKPKNKRRSRQDILQLLEAFTKAGISVQTFCDQHNIGKSTFHKWQSRYKHKAEASSTATAFSAINIISAAGYSATLYAEVNGIKLYQPVSAAYLKELL